ncbi:DUF998 domain-containing protein [Streptomyces sp. NPDC101490]|uniref:DUF998 domain-containing protein n=1 Tax=Streptomyces sp. NPDC101490 TaxID=3366143 RepID=UPI003814DCBB
MPAKVTRAAAVLLALGALAYTTWVVEVVVQTGLDPIRTYVSELAAQDQPLGGLFRATDLAAGALVLAGALAGLLTTTRRYGAGAGTTAVGSPPGAGTTAAGSAPGAGAATVGPAPRAGAGPEGSPPRRRRPWEVVGWAALALFGAATVADSRLPLSCAPTVDPACAARETAGLVPATHTAHAVSSSLAMTGALVAIVALTVAARRHGRLRPLARTGPVLVVLEFAATAWTLVAVAAFEAGKGIWSLGAGQRLQVLLVAVWIGVLAYALATEDRRERP